LEGKDKTIGIRNCPTEVQTALQETLTKLQEAEKLEKREEEQTKGKDETTRIPKPDPQPSLGSYYNLLEGGKIIP